MLDGFARGIAAQLEVPAAVEVPDDEVDERMRRLAHVDGGRALIQPVHALRAHDLH